MHLAREMTFPRPIMSTSSWPNTLPFPVPQWIQSKAQQARLTSGTKKSTTKKRLKVSDIPIPSGHDGKATFNDVVICLLDWAGTSTDPFGTNSHEDLPDRIREAWRAVFGPGEDIDLMDNPAILKVISKTTFGTDTSITCSHL